MSDAWDELCRLVKEAGGVMRLHGKPTEPDAIRAYAKERARLRLDAAIARSIARKAEEDAWREVWRDEPKVDR